MKMFLKQCQFVQCTSWRTGIDMDVFHEKLRKSLGSHLYVFGQWIEVHVHRVDWIFSTSRDSLFFLLAPRIDGNEPSWWNYMEQGTVTGVLWIGGVLSELFVILFGLCSVLAHRRLSNLNGCLGINYSPQVEWANSSRILASVLPFTGRILKTHTSELKKLR